MFARLRQAEDTGVDADAEGKDGDGGGGKTRGLGQQAQRETKIVKERGHGGAPFYPRTVGENFNEALPFGNKPQPGIRALPRCWLGS